MVSKSVSDTKKIAKSLALEGKNRVYALVGDLGVGKTTFVRAFLQALGVKSRITSPTFLIIRSYGNIYHIDCYRIDKPSELVKLGFKEILNPPAGGKNNVILIEWADRVRKLLPKNTQWIYFEHGKKENERNIIIN